jgi:hypothetical protein
MRNGGPKGVEMHGATFCWLKIYGTARQASGLWGFDPIEAVQSYARPLDAGIDRWPR